MTVLVRGSVDTVPRELNRPSAKVSLFAIPDELLLLLLFLPCVISFSISAAFA